MIETELDAALKTLSVGARVYPRRIPERPTLPALDYRRVSTVPALSHSGHSGAGTVRYQFRTWGTTYAAARALRDELVTYLKSYRGTGIHHLLWDNDLDITDQPGIFGVAVDFLAFCYE